MSQRKMKQSMAMTGLVRSSCAGGGGAAALVLLFLGSVDRRSNKASRSVAGFCLLCCWRLLGGAGDRRVGKGKGDTDRARLGLVGLGMVPLPLAGWWTQEVCLLQQWCWWQ